MKKEFSYIRLVYASLTFAFLTSSAAAQVNRPLVNVPLTDAAPVIDGKLSDASWQKASEISEFVNWTLNSYISDPVTIYLCYDEENLYVAFRNADPAAQDLIKTVDPKGPRDTFLWGRNHAMVATGYNGMNIRVMADPKGTMTDWKNNNITWNGEWKYSASVNQADWTAEFSIPLKDIGLSAKMAGEVMNLTLSRSFPTGESSDWSGDCVLSDMMPVKFDIEKWPQPVPGENKIAFRAVNFGSEAVKLKCELELIPLNAKPEFINQRGQGPSSDLQLSVSSGPLYYCTEHLISPGNTYNNNLSFNLPNEGSYYASATVKSEDGSVIRRSVDYWFTIEPNREKLNSLKESIGESIASMTRISNPVANKLRDEAGDILSDIQKLLDNSDKAWSSGGWNEHSAETAKKEIEVARHLHKVRWSSLKNWQSGYDFGIGLTHSVIKLRKDAMFPVPLKDCMEISLAGNEYESFQLALLPFGRDLKGLRVEISDLTDEAGNTISKERFEISLVEYNYIDWQADYVTEYSGWHPDPLFPFESINNVNGHDVCRPLWITLFVPAGTKAGEYDGKITIGADGMKEITAEIKCRVRDFELPITSNLKTHSWDQIEYFADFYDLDEYPVEWYLKFCEVLLKNRFNPGSAGINYISQSPDRKGRYDFTRVEQVLDFCIKRGLTRFTVLQMKKGLYAPGEDLKEYKFIEAYARFLKEKGWLDKALVELWDEPTDLEWPYIKERAERLKKIDPGLRLQLFAEGGPYDFWDRSTDKYGLNDLIDIWAPVNIIESPETQAKGGEIWTYFCTLARESAPNFFIDCPAVYQRSIAWYCWMYGVDGFEHWSTNYFWRNVHKGKPVEQKWPNIPWDSRTYYYFNGEGQLVYPGPSGTVLSSVRLENFRDGMEDYEYLSKLKELLKEYDEITDDPELNRFRQLLYPEHYLLFKYPRKIKVTLENTLRHPDQPELFIETRNKIAEAIEQLQNR